MRESSIENYLIEQVKLRGGEIRKATWPGRRGAPDRRVMHPRLGCWVELKAPGKKLAAHQAREIDKMREMGEIVHVFDTKEKIDEWLSSTPSKHPIVAPVEPRTCYLMRGKKS